MEKTFNINSKKDLDNFNKQLKKASKKIGDKKITKELLKNIKNSYIKDDLYYNKKTDERLYPTKPEWSERVIHDFSKEEAEEHLNGEYDQETLDLLNHIIIERDGENK